MLFKSCFFITHHRPLPWCKSQRKLSHRLFKDMSLRKKPSVALLEALLVGLSSCQPGNEAYVTALHLASASLSWRGALLQTHLASLVTINGAKLPFQTSELLADSNAPPFEVVIDIRMLQSYQGMARAMLQRMFKALQLIIARVSALIILNHDSDHYDFDMNKVINTLFYSRNNSYPAPPMFTLDFGNRIYRCETPITIHLGSVSSLCVRNVYLNWFSLASALNLRRLTITRTSSPMQRIPLFILYDVLTLCAGTLELLELDHAVNWTDTGNLQGFWDRPRVALLALKTLSLGYQFVQEAVAVVMVIYFPKVDTLTLRDGAHDLPSLGIVNDSTALLYLIAQQKEDSDFCVRTSFENVVFNDVLVNRCERLTEYFLRTVCAADVLNLLYHEDLDYNAAPFIKAMGVAEMAIGTQYLRVQGIDYYSLTQELVRCFVRAPGDTRPRDEAILEPAYVDIIHSDMADPDIREDFIQYFVTSGLASALRVRACVTDEAETGTQWEPSTPLALEWRGPLADERGVIDRNAYKFSPDVEMSVEEELEKVFDLDEVVQFLLEKNITLK